jgi:hypothetical protein
MCCVAAAAVWRLMWVRRSEIFGKALSGITNNNNNSSLLSSSFYDVFSFLGLFFSAHSPQQQPQFIDLGEAGKAMHGNFTHHNQWQNGNKH